MKTYILNETPIRTSNNFQINDITLDLEIPKEYNFKELDILNLEDNKGTSTIKKNFQSRIGLSLDEYLETKLEIKNDTKKPIIINCDVNNFQVNNIIINISKNTIAEIIIKFTGKGFHSSKIITNLEEYSNLRLDVINTIDDSSISLISMENELQEKANLDYNFIDLGGKVRISNYFSNLISYESKNMFNNIYVANNEDIVDINDYMIIKGIKAIGNMKIEGSIDGKAKKSFKGTIDFLSGSKDSIGEENENCVILSDEAISKSLPVLLCSEESVTGAHGVSSGKIDHNKLFYLMSRGLNEQESKRLIINANFNSIINNLIDEDMKQEILDIINKKID